MEIYESMARRNLSIILTLSVICNILFLHHLISNEAYKENRNFIEELINRRKDIDVKYIGVKKPKSENNNVHANLASIVEPYFNQKFIFIVGAMSSGTTLMRLILDVHPEVNCGDETKIVHLLLEFVSGVYKDSFYVKFMNNSGVKNETINNATALFIYYMMENNKKNLAVKMNEIKYFCNKEPMNTYHMIYLHKLFPNARFVYVVRDGRDVAFSLLRRNKLDYTFERFYEILNYWESKNRLALGYCNSMGTSVCQMMKYENLVTSPEAAIRNLTKFLALSWTDELLHHEKYLGRNISLSAEPIFAGIQKNEINNNSIGKWKQKILNYNEKLINDNIVMLKEFNYY